MKQRIFARICVTGSIACGKSSVGETLARAGLPVIEADDVSHDLFRSGNPVADRVVAAFGPKVLTRGGEINRRALGRIIFFNDKERARLNAIVHPEVRRVINMWFKARENSGSGAAPDRSAREKIAAAVIPLAYEAGWDRGWDAVICVAAPLSFQIARLKQKGLSEKDARARIAAQMSLDEKMSRADYVVINAGTVADLRQQTMLVFRSIKEQMEKSHGRKK